MTDSILSGVWPEWTIVKQLGRGSYGTVYEAVRKDEYGLESHAAIKIISIPQDESEVDSLRSEGLSAMDASVYLRNIVTDFVREIQLMESFKGVQNIVSVEDYKVLEKKDQIGWDIFIRMELLTPFNDYLTDRTMTEQEAIKLGCDICTALELCETRQVIHRDIKPENIFVSSFGDFKLGDFGVARSLENLTSSLSTKGTYSYMAPEVEKGQPYDATVDQYSLGLVLYRLMNRNRLPFLNTEKQLLSPNERKMAVRRRLDGETLPPPSEASPALAEIILRACSPLPENRFASAAEMKRALTDAAKGVSRNDDAREGTVVVRHAAKAVPEENAELRRKKASPAHSTGEEKPAVPRFVWYAAGIMVVCALALFLLPRLLDARTDDKTEEPKETSAAVSTASSETPTETTGLPTSEEAAATPTPPPAPTRTPGPGPADLAGCVNGLAYPNDSWLPTYETKYVKTRHGKRAYLLYQPAKNSDHFGYVYEADMVTVLARENAYSLVRGADGSVGWVTSTVLVDNYG